MYTLIPHPVPISNLSALGLWSHALCLLCRHRRHSFLRGVCESEPLGLLDKHRDLRDRVRSQTPSLHEVQVGIN